MITTTKAFQTSDNKTHSTLEDAQKHELFTLMVSAKGHTFTDAQTQQFCDVVLSNADKVVDVLTTTTKSKTRARSINGGRKRRTPTAVSTQAQPT